MLGDRIQYAFSWTKSFSFLFDVRLGYSKWDGLDRFCAILLVLFDLTLLLFQTKINVIVIILFIFLFNPNFHVFIIYSETIKFYKLLFSENFSELK